MAIIIFEMLSIDRVGICVLLYTSFHVVSWPPKPEVVILYPTFLFLTLPGGSPDSTSLRAESPHPASRCGWGTQTIALWTLHPVLTPRSQPSLQH